MPKERWILDPQTRSSLERLHKTAGTRSVVAMGAGRNYARLETGHAEPAFSLSQDAGGAHSAVAGGWVCCGLGLASAWFFPLSHGFFAVAFVLSMVAMLARLTRQGVGLMAASLASCAACVLVSSYVVAPMTSGDTGHAASAVQPVEPAANGAADHAAAGIPAAAYIPPRPVAGSPVTINEIALMLRTGFNDDEVVAAIRSKQLVEPAVPSRMDYLRSLGGGEKLVSFLRGRTIYSAPMQNIASAPATVIVRDAAPSSPPVQTSAAPPQTSAAPAQAQADGNGNIPPTNYQARDQRIQELKERIDALDEDVRVIRTNPKNYRYWWMYYAGYNGMDSQKRDAYLKKLDQERNDLRREKWQLEGR